MLSLKLNQSIDFLFLPIFVIAFIGVDFILKINFLYWHIHELSRIGGLLKLILLLFMLSSFLFKKEKEDNLYYYLLFLLLSFVLGQVFLKKSEILNNFCYEIIQGDIYYFLRYTFICIFILHLNTRKHLNQTINLLIKIFYVIIIINSFCVVLGFLLDLEVFKSYPKSLRFGYSGIFTKVSDANYFYILGIIKFTSDYISTKKFKFLVFVIGLIIVSLFFGTKLMLIFPFIWLYFYTYFCYGFNLRIQSFFLFFIFVVIVFKNFILKLFIQIFPFWNDIYREYDWLTVFSSRRDILVVNFFNFIEDHWLIFNYVLGGSKYRDLNVQIEILDLYYVLGIPGLLFFYFLFKKHFCNFNINKLPYLLMILVASMFSGNLLISVNCMIFFFVVFKKISTN